MSDFKFETKNYLNDVGTGTLMASKCKECGNVSAPYRHICPKCHSRQGESLQLSGRARLLTYTVIYIGPTEMVNAGYDAKTPYCSGIVELEEGPRLSAQILGLDLSNPQAIAIGQPLVFTAFERGPEGARKTALAFKPA
ncbi:MAG: Zn-ribbon domain-containing OB-fold protein [Anaerolineaceae bacterium]|nr:Zn-ribbon domain-containing OB-fold protein [Anaerolineaceae bacterium]